MLNQLLTDRRKANSALDEISEYYRNACFRNKGCLHIIYICGIFFILQSSKYWSWISKIFLKAASQHSSALHYSFLMEKRLLWF